MNGIPVQDERVPIALETAEIISHTAHACGQYILVLKAPLCARRARPGTFVHLGCGPGLQMRRPFSIMRAMPEAGLIELLYKTVGRGTALLASQRPGQSLSCLGPIGQPFIPDRTRPQALLIGGGVGIPPMVFLADWLRRQPQPWQPLALFASELPFPFNARPSRMLLANLPAGTIATMPLLEDWGIACRLASRQGFPGCYEGLVTELAEYWLARASAEQRRQIAVYACGPEPMLAATARLARRYDLPCQIALEEYMACGVGGCAGCTVRVHTRDGPAMKRVCVDGPAFEARSIYPD